MTNAIGSTIASSAVGTESLDKDRWLHYLQKGWLSAEVKLSGSVIILASLGDEHACAVHKVLETLGVSSHIYMPTEILGAGEVTVDYRAGEPRLRLGDFEGALGDIRSSWNRRLSQTFREPAFVHPADREHLVYAAHSINRGVAALLDERFPVNTLASSVITSNKLVQLAHARREGFRIPRTIVSSDPSAITAFVASEAQACVKPYTMYSWVTDEGVRASTTALLDAPLTLDPESMALVPDIYQEFIRKEAEYRVTLFGGFVAVTVVGDRLSAAGAIDWRADTSYLEGLSQAHLPDRVIEALRRIMKSLGLRFGTFDIARDSEGDYVFFEVNESGQWLWQELYAEGCSILEPFSRFLAAADDRFTWEPKRGSDFSARDVLAEVRQDRRYGRILPTNRMERSSVTEQDLLAHAREQPGSVPAHVDAATGGE